GRRIALFGAAALLALGAWVLARLGDSNDPLAAGKLAYERCEWSAAAGRARDVLKSAPGDRQAVRLLARASARLEHDQLAGALFGQLPPDAWEAEDNLLLARILARRDRFDLSLPQLWKAHRKDPASGEAILDLVQALRRTNSLAHAAEMAAALEK